MKLQKSFGKLKKPRLLFRRVVGESMAPALQPNQLVVAIGWRGRAMPGTIVIIRHDGLEKIKRLMQVDDHKGIFVLGDNPVASTDSRSFGWLPHTCIQARVIWPRKL